MNHLHEKCRPVATVLLIGLLATAAGCSSEPEFGVVSGQVLINGKPAGGVAIEFHPDAEKGTVGVSSTGEADENGNYKLSYATPKRHGDGAVVGRHKVVLRDLKLAASETGAGVPIRFGPEYSSVLTTPLEYEVKPGEQTINIEVPVR